MVKLSLIGSLFAAAVILVRLIFRKAPKWLFCVLWGVVALRLICPVSIESSLSLVPDRLASGQIFTNVGNEYIGDVDIIYESNAGYSNAIEAGRQPIFTNALTISPVMVAELYHNRWQIELFFKWIKQHLKIKKFWGTSENAVRIQIYSAIIAYCMMAIVQKKMNIERSIYEMLQIVSISLTDTTNLKDLFAKPNYNIVNELDGSTEPSLF